jgi:hypothetical protein
MTCDRCGFTSDRAAAFQVLHYPTRRLCQRCINETCEAAARHDDTERNRPGQPFTRGDDERDNEDRRII